MKMVVGVCAIGFLALAGAGVAPARKVLPVQKVLLQAIARQEARAQIAPADAARDRSAVDRAALLIRHLPSARSAPLATQLAQAAGLAGELTTPRALAVFGQLTVNDDWFAAHGPPASKTDITDANGLVYRYFSGGGFELHPLADFSALNAAVASKNVAATARLATALIARGVPLGGGATGWEYYFDYAGGDAPWLSGFAQAVAAQSFARAASLVPADAAALNAAARAAYRAIPGRLERQITAGPWIKLYSFTTLVVLNAQLQSAISLADYAAAESDPGAAALATRMESAAARALPLFDTGYWTYYSLPQNPSSLAYQEYVVELLQRLAKANPVFAAAATRLADYQTEQPTFKLANSGPGAVTFWVSKPSTVRIAALGDVRRLDLAGGWHTVSWSLPARAGIYPVTIHASDWAGNSAEVSALPIVRVASPPKPKRPPKKRETASVESRAAVALPPLNVGVALDEPAQASLAATDGFGAARMTLVWPAGSPTPDPGAITALNRLPAGTNLTLELYVAPLPSDQPGQAELASYAASVAEQVPDLHDLVLGPAATQATAVRYVAALAAVYDAVKQAAPSVRVDGALDGTQAPKATLAALAAAYRASGRSTPLMDELAFHPAPTAGKNLWPLGDLPTLVSSLDTGFGGTAQAGESLPLIIDDVAVESTIPPPELSLYTSPSVGATGLGEPAQAAAYAALLNTVACRADVVEVVFHRLIDAVNPGEQSGLYYADGTPKTSLQAVVSAVAGAQGSTRGCAGATPSVPASPPASAPPASGSAPGTVPSTGSSDGTGSGAQPSAPPPTKPSEPTTPVPLATPGALAFPNSVAAVASPTVRLGCTKACLYLVALQRAGDGIPVLARRGATSAGQITSVRLPQARVGAGTYRFVVWLISTTDPGPVVVERSAVFSTR